MSRPIVVRGKEMYSATMTDNAIIAILNYAKNYHDDVSEIENALRVIEDSATVKECISCFNQHRGDIPEVTSIVVPAHGGKSGEYEDLTSVHI